MHIALKKEIRSDCSVSVTCCPSLHALGLLTLLSHQPVVSALSDMFIP